MNSWCSRCQQYTENTIGSALVRVLDTKKIRITNYSCDKCHTFKESIVEEIPIKTERRENND